METLAASIPAAPKAGTVPQHNPEHILKIGMGFWASKTVLTAVDFKLFTMLARAPMRAEAIRAALGLHPRAYLDFLDALVALGFLTRAGMGADGVYANSPDADFFLDRGKPSYLGGILEMCEHRLYKYWGDLGEGLKTGLPQNEIKTMAPGSGNQFDAIYANPEALKGFLGAMSGIQMGAFMALAKNFDFSAYATFCDAGGADGSLCLQVARNHPNLQCTSFDLPAVEKIARENIAKHHLEGQVKAVAGDFFKGELPKSDVIAMGNILHDWNDEEKLNLMKKAFAALPRGGAFICIENIIDNDRSQNVFGLLMSLNMLIETKTGADFTFNDFDRLTRQAGFTRTEWLPLAGPTSAAVAYK